MDNFFHSDNINKIPWQAGQETKKEKNPSAGESEHIKLTLSISHLMTK